MSLYLRRPVVWSEIPEAFARVADPHCTIIYSKTASPDRALNKRPMVARVIGNRLFTPSHANYTAATYLLDDEKDYLHSRHTWLKYDGATVDYPFTPHVTYQYAMPGEKLAPPIEDPFWVVLGPEVASELPDPEWLPNATIGDRMAYNNLERNGFQP